MEKETENRFKKIEKRVEFIEASVSTSLSKPGRPIRCVYCNHSWKTQSKAKMVSCPNCSRKTPANREDIEKANKKADEDAERFIKKQERLNKRYPTRFK